LPEKPQAAEKPVEMKSVSSSDTLARTRAQGRWNSCCRRLDATLFFRHRHRHHHLRSLLQPLQPRSRELVLQSACGGPRLPVRLSCPRFAMLPSVGTWLAPNSLRVAEARPAQSGRKLEGKLTAAQVAPAAAAAAPVVAQPKPAPEPAPSVPVSDVL
jgi:hypothetical protein